MVRALVRRALNEIFRVPGAAIPGILAPTIFFLGLTSVFGSLTLLPGFTTSSYQSFLIPISMLQGAGFTGAATGVNLARDIEQGWFDRLLASPAPRPVLLAGLVLSASLRSLIPATFLLVVGLAIGVHWPGFLGLADRPRSGDGDGGRRSHLGHLARLQFRTQSAAPADAGRDVARRPHHHRLRAAAPAHRLAADGRQVSTRSPRSSRPSARASSARSPGRTPGPASSRSWGSSRCSATSRCAACAG